LGKKDHRGIKWFFRLDDAAYEDGRRGTFRKRRARRRLNRDVIFGAHGRMHAARVPSFCAWRRPKTNP
jgi:hypothetical protein